MADITYFISASYLGAGLEESNFLLFHTECNNPDYQIAYSGSNIIPSSSLAEGLTLNLDSSITTLHLYPVSEDCPLGCGYNYSINLTLPVSPTPTPSPTVSITPTISSTPAISSTPGASSTPSPTRTISVTPPNSPIPDPSPTPSITIPPTEGVSPTPSISVTPPISVTPSNTPSISNTPSPSVTPSISISVSSTPSISNTPAISVTPSISKTPPSSATPSVTPSRSLPTEPCTEWAFTAFGGTMVFQYYDCQGQARSVTVYNGYPERKCVLGGTTPIAYPVTNGATGIAENLGSVCTYVN